MPGMKQGFLLYINLSLLKTAVHKTAFSNIFCQLTEMIFQTYSDLTWILKEFSQFRQRWLWL